METSVNSSTETGFVQRFLAKITTIDHEQGKDPVIKKINSFQSLPEGWDYGQGNPCDRRVIKKAIEIFSLAKLQGFSSEAQPTTEGGIVMILSKRDHFLDVVINPNLTLDVRIEKGIGDEYEVLFEDEDVSKADVLNLLNHTKQLYLECHLFAPFIRTSTVNPSVDSRQNISDLTVAEFQYSMESVLC